MMSNLDLALGTSVSISILSRQGALILVYGTQPRMALQMPVIYTNTTKGTYYVIHTHTRYQS